MASAPAETGSMVKLRAPHLEAGAAILGTCLRRPQFLYLEDRTAIAGEEAVIAAS